MSILFEPKSIGRMTVKNRLVRAPTVEKLASDDGHCTPKLMDLYTRLAEGGVGMVITGGAYPQSNGKGLPRQIGLHRDEVIDGYKKLTDRMHQYEVKIIAQLVHCGRQGTAEVLGETPIAPSAVPNILGVTPIPMNSAQISGAIDNFIRAAERAKMAGFDGVQIHAAHGYLIHEFLSPRTNKRRDQWGGSPANRMRFLSEVYQGMRKRLGDEYPILLSINCNDFLPDGLGSKEAAEIAERMSSLGVDAIEPSAGTWETHFHMSRGDIPRNYWLYSRAKGEEKERFKARLSQMAKEVRFKEAYHLEYSGKIKKKIRCPLILVGGLRTVKIMEKTLAEGVADFIALCRPLIRDTEFPNLIRRGLVDRSSCIDCNLCLTDKPVACYQMRYRPPHF
jgi:2,4-dienoyl-CoA reductase-like NADH-dependent reductase (Old Yellow Enzyme family)